MRFVLATLLLIVMCASPAAAAPMAPPPGGGKFPLPESWEPMPETTMRATGNGRLAVQAVQGTSGGAPIASAPLTVRLVHRGAVVYATDSQLDEHGVVLLEGLPVAMGVQPVVEVAWAGVTYRQVGTMMSAAEPEQRVEVTCYEVTGETPPWRVRMRHVIVSPAEQGAGVKVSEMLVVDNPAERTWLGTTAPATGERPATTSFALPAGAAGVGLGRGFHGWCCTELRDGRLVSFMPLMPETTEMTYTYILPAVDGATELRLVAPAVVEHLMIALPQQVRAGGTEGLTPGGTQSLEGGSVSYLLAENQQPGESAAVRLVLAANDVTVASTGAPLRPMRLVAAVGGGLIVLLAAAVILFRPRSARPVTA